MAKKKKLKQTVNTRAEMEILAGEIVRLKNLRDSKEARMNTQIHKIKELYEQQFAILDEDIDYLKDCAQDWFDRNSTDDAKKKSIELLHAIAGYRTSPPALKTLKGWTWETVLEKLKIDGHLNYIRTIEEVNKELFIENRSMLDAEVLAELGLRIFQKENFFVDPKHDGTDPVISDSGQ